MNSTTKTKINNAIEQLSNQHKEFTDKVNSVNSLNIYSAEETKRRRIEIQKQFEEKAKITSANLKKCLADWLLTDINSLSSDKEKETNLQRVYTDFNLLSVGDYSDKNIFLIIKPYIGDMLSMKKLAGITKLNKPESRVAYYILSRADSIDDMQNKVEEGFAHYLDLTVRKYSSVANSVSNLAFVTYEQTLLNTVENFERTINMLLQAKTASYEDIKIVIR